VSRDSGTLLVEDLHVAYGPVEAVRGVSLEVPSGGLVTLIGANGAGKSTTLAAISGLVRPRAGRIVLDGLDVTRWRSHRRVAAGLVQVPEGREILATMTVLENLQLGAWHQAEHFQDSLSEVFERFPVLAERRNLSAGSLSGGEQQMLAIARALMASPQFLLLDEPSLGLAPFLVRDIFHIIREINATGVSILLVEQNANQALHIARRAYVMETGRIVLEGPTGEIAASDEVKAAYLGG
jgi:branched-chain amino acid transport system ATP-binding protein